MAKSEKYRLQIVLERKEEARDEAARHLAEMREQLHKEQQEEARLREELRQNRERQREEYENMLKGGPTGGLNVSETHQALNYIKYLDVKAKELDGAIEVQKIRVQKAEKAVEEALQELIQASRELQVMQKHKERWEKKMRFERERKDQEETNEIGNVIYVANRSPRNGEVGEL